MTESSEFTRALRRTWLQVSRSRPGGQRLSRSGVLVVMGGTATVQIVSVALSPVLSRLYSPTAFGHLAFFVSVVALVGSVSTGRYDLAILLPRSHRQSGYLVVLALGASFVSSVLLLALAVLWMQVGRGGGLLPGWAQASIPVSVFLTAAITVLQSLANRRGKYAILTKAGVIQAGANVSVSLALGLGAPTDGGLLMGFLAGQITGLAYLVAAQHHELARLRSSCSVKRLKATACRYVAFPRYSIASGLVESGAAQLPVLLFGSLFGGSALGLFSLAQRALRIPASLVSGSVGTVFRSEASASYRQTGSCRRLLVHTAMMLAALGAIPTVCLVLYAPSAFALVFGETWREAGVLGQILAPVLFLQFVASPISAVFYFAGRQRADLMIQSATLVAAALSMWVGGSISVRAAVGLYAATYMAKYILEGALSVRWSERRGHWGGASGS